MIIFTSIPSEDNESLYSIGHCKSHLITCIVDEYGLSAFSDSINACNISDSLVPVFGNS